jgi:hypothetical protein
VSSAVRASARSRARCAMSVSRAFVCEASESRTSRKAMATAFW